MPASVGTEEILMLADTRTRKNHNFNFKHFQAVVYDSYSKHDIECQRKKQQEYYVTPKVNVYLHVYNARLLSSSILLPSHQCAPRIFLLENRSP